LFEYLTLGKPTVASDLQSIREILTDNVTALLVPPGDAASLAAALTRVTQDATLAGRLGAAALALSADYTWDRRAERLEAALMAATA
jgi:glycosyltransferase involved in cell wall biosynthesis